MYSPYIYDLTIEVIVSDYFIAGFEIAVIPLVIIAFAGWGIAKAIIAFRSMAKS